MKTTIELPDDLFFKVKVIAAERRTTLKDLIVQGLNLVTQTTHGSEEKKRQTALKRLLKGLKASNTKAMTPLKREEIYDR